MTTRIKPTDLTFRSRDDFERDGIDQIAAHTVTLRYLETERDRRIQAVRDVFADDIAQISHGRTALVMRAERYALAHRDELLPARRQSTETALARWGFRIGQPTLKTLARVTWKKVLAQIKATGRAELVRTKEDIDKEALRKLDPATLSSLGVRVDQVETFYIEPKDQPFAADPK